MTERFGATEPETDPLNAPAIRPRSRRLRDITVTPFPIFTPEQWREPDVVLTMLYRKAEAHALESVDWYLRDRRWKKRISQLLRALAILLFAAGGLQPLINSGDDGRGLRWGYVFIAAAGACVAFDRYFGVSTRWMRDIVTAQQLQRLIHTFQYDWAALNAKQDHTVEATLEHLRLLRAFLIEVSDIAIAETSQWVTEFQSAFDQLKKQAQ